MAVIHPALIEKLQKLPPRRLAEVEDFVDFLHMREGEQRVANEAARMAEGSFAAVWNNDEDSAYDRI